MLQPVSVRALAVGLGVIVVGVVGVVATASADRPTGRSGSNGWRIYDRYCLACHGELGDGHGPAAPFTSPAPRAFTSGTYKWGSTEADLRAAIRFGAPGTSMPGFDGVLSARDLDDALAVIEGFAPVVGAPTVTLGAPPAPSDRGAQLWTTWGCNTCHGPEGRGDGAAAIATPPFDLTVSPLRRPRAHDDDDARRRAAATSIARGLPGTAMPSYAQLPDAELWALADRIVAINAHAARGDRSTLERAQIDADRAAPLATGIWPGTGSDTAIWGMHLAPQGPPPASLAPAEASLSAEQCARCHAKQAREWRGSLHAGAGSPGLYAQLDDPAPWHGQPDTCRRCHAPLAEQMPGASYDPSLRSEGITCASCHLRAWTRNGPPASADSLLAVPSYPKQPRAIYERGDFCMPCHQLPPRNAVEGKPLLNTYEEWLEGPYMRRGIECQHCHMPNREHQWLGVHDPATFRQGIQLTVIARPTARGASVVVQLANVGAGHYLPTTPTPAVWLRVQLHAADGSTIAGASAAQRIGRDIYFKDGWHQRADTRIPPGEKMTLAKAWQGGRSKDAAFVRVTVEVDPDAYYEGFYVGRLAAHPPAAIRAQYEQALARARASHYVAVERDVALQ
jgi:mono/diheme cytochrome c family protein